MFRALLLAIGMTLVTAASAGACACAAISPGQKLRDADVAFVGKVLSFRDEGPTRIYTIGVERVYKGDVGATAEIRARNPTEGPGTDCEEFFTVDQEAGGYFRGAPEQWYVGTCNRATRDELEAAAAEIGTSGRTPAAAPAFIARGPFGNSRFAITDGAGRPIAYAPASPDDREPGALSPCPGGEFLIEGLVVRRVSDLAQVGTLGTGRQPGQVRCVRADGRAAVGFTPNRLSSRGELVRLTPGRTRTLARGPWAMAALGDRRSALAAVNPGGTLVLVDNASGRRRVVRRANRNCVDLELSPDQSRVAETVSRRRGERATTAFVHDLDGRSRLRRRIDGHDLVWYRRDRIATVTYDNHARIYDARLTPVSKRFAAGDGATFGAFGDLWWVRAGMLHRRGAEVPVKLELPTRGPLIPIRAS